MINPKSYLYVQSGYNGSTGEKVVVTSDAGALARVVVGSANTGGDSANIILYDTNDATLANSSDPSNILCTIDANNPGEYNFEFLFHTGLVYEVSGDYGAGEAPKFTIIYE